MGKFTKLSRLFSGVMLHLKFNVCPFGILVRSIAFGKDFQTYFLTKLFLFKCVLLLFDFC